MSEESETKRDSSPPHEVIKPPRRSIAKHVEADVRVRAMKRAVAKVLRERSTIRATQESSYRAKSRLMPLLVRSAYDAGTQAYAVHMLADAVIMLENAFCLYIPW